MKLQRFRVGIAAWLACIGICVVLLVLADTLQAEPQTAPQKADAILILKKDHLMELLAGGKVIRTYKVALGQGGLAPKAREGDARTPEGHYVIDSRNAASHYHRALHVSYPDAEDRKRAAKLGVSPGGSIMIHGLPSGEGWIGAAHRLHDWTLGCIAVTDQEIDEIWSLVPIGTPVEIRP
ncbi:MAG: L,D-transpeptidase family protein [Terracidiphilus sp.]|jgi:murein L,D-transpeptidase YafK